MWLEEEKRYLKEYGEIQEYIRVSEENKKRKEDVLKETYELLSKIDPAKISGKDGLEATVAIVNEMNKVRQRERKVKEETETEPTERIKSLVKTFKKWGEESNNASTGQMPKEEPR